MYFLPWVVVKKIGKSILLDQLTFHIILLVAERRERLVSKSD